MKISGRPLSKPTNPTVAKFLEMSASQLDDVFQNSSSAGTVPDGFAKGTALVTPGHPMEATLAQVIALTAWQGKVFTRNPDNPETATLVNKIGPTGQERVEAEVYKGQSWLDGKQRR